MKLSALTLGIIVLVTAAPAFAQLKPQTKEDEVKEILKKKAASKPIIGVSPSKSFSSIMLDKMMAQSDSLGELQMSFRGTFWRDPEYVTSLGLTNDQQKKMEETFRQYRLKLID